MQSWSRHDPYDRWPAAAATDEGFATGYRPVLIHNVRGTDAVIIEPANDRLIDTAVVPVGALVPLAEFHRTTRQFCVAVMERVAATTLEHFVDEWKDARFAGVVDGRLVEPADLACEDRTV
jgi:hypothetical protein